MPDKPLCLREKIIEIACELEMDKDGRNEFSKYDYFRSDVLFFKLKPLFKKYKVFAKLDPDELLDTGKTKYVLRIENIENEEFELYTMTVDPCIISGANAVQNKGGQRTYVFRYLLMGAFYVSDDSDDPDHGPRGEQPQAPSKKPEPQKQVPPAKKPQAPVADPAQKVAPAQKPEAAPVDQASPLETPKPEPVKELKEKANDITIVPPPAATPAQITPAPDLSATVICERCKKEVLPTKSYTVQGILDISQQRHHMNLCADCIKALKAEAKVSGATAGEAK